MPSSSAAKSRRVVTAGAITVGVTVILFLLIEGAASSFLALDAALSSEGPTPNRYDEWLGWTGRPNVTLPDFYGDGASIITNGRGFRNEADFDAREAEGTIRVICSGDSFTFGQGVGTGEAWCDLLGNLDLRIESVNLGISGYGIGQAMLRYERDAAELEHTLHLFAFVAADVPRTTSPSHHGYGRPVLELDGGDLRVVNVPVPRLRNWVSRLAQSLSEELRSVDFAGRVVRRLVSPTWVSRGERIALLAPVASRTFARTAEVALKRGAEAVFVYLPVESEIRQVNEWEAWVVSVLDSLDLPLVNLAEALRGVSPDLARTYFLEDGHYSVSGNRWAADALYQRLVADLRVRSFVSSGPTVGS